MDLKSKLSWVPLVFLVLVIVGIFVGIYYYYNPPIQSPDDPKPGCVVMRESGDSSEKVDIVFLGDNYNNLNEFISKTEEYMEKWNTLSPFDVYLDSFNFYRVEDFSELGCTYDEAVICDNRKVKNAAKLCPHDYIAVSVDVNGVQRLSNYLRSSAWKGVMHLSNADSWFVFPHEFAHVFANFADEYDYAGPITWDAPNCDSKMGSCPMFSPVPEAECVVGCSDLNHARSIYKGIMRDYWTGPKIYGAYNEWYLGGVLKGLVEVSEVGERGRSPLASVNVVYSNKGYAIESVEPIGDGFADGINRPELAHGYRVRTGGYLSATESSNIFTDYQGEGGVAASERGFSVILPLDAVGESVELIKVDAGAEKVIDAVLIGPSDLVEGGALSGSLEGAKTISIPGVS